MRPAYLPLVADAPSPPPWPGAPRLSRVQAAQRRLAFALTMERTVLPLVPDLWAEVATDVRGVCCGVNGVLEAAGLVRYKAPIVSVLRPSEQRTTKPLLYESEAQKRRRLGPLAWATFADTRSFGELKKHEQVMRLRGYMADPATRHFFEQLCGEAGMTEVEFERLLRVAGA